VTIPKETTTQPVQQPEPDSSTQLILKPVSALSGGGRSTTPTTRTRSNSCSFKVGETIREAVKNPIPTTIYPRWEVYISKENASPMDRD
jgi:hypothetical protein